jgi:hypothetical protein
MGTGVIERGHRQEYATYLNTDGEQIRTVVMDEANYNIARVKKEFDSGSSIGILTTLIIKTGSCRHAGGIDWEFFFRGGNIRSPDRSGAAWGGETGMGLGTEFSKNSGKHIRGSIGLNTNPANWISIRRLLFQAGLSGLPRDGCSIASQ